MYSQKFMIVKALLDGQVLSIMKSFRMFGCTNLPRELSRAVIHPKTGFNANVIKKQVEFVSKYGNHGYYFEYRLDFSDKNKKAIKKMKEYLKTKN